MTKKNSKKYIPNQREKYMCEKHKSFFKKKLNDWKIEINKSGLFEAINPNTSHLMSFFPGLLPGEHLIQPKTGMLNLFPSYMRHGLLNQGTTLFLL